MSAEVDPAAALRYCAFISYSRADRDIAKTIQTRLEQFVLPRALRSIKPGLKRDRRPLRPVFRDEDELIAGQDLPARILKGLRESEYLVVVCSPHSAKSEWVEKEILDFVSLDKKENILAVVVDGVPNANARGSDPCVEALPAALRYDLLPNASQGRSASMRISVAPTEPLWIDWRGDANKDRTALLRLVAALLSLARFDDLIRRDATRRRVRLISYAVAASLGSIAVTGAIIGLSQDIRQRNISASEQMAALAGQAADVGYYDRAARYALAGVRYSDWPLIGFEPKKAEAQLRRAAGLSSLTSVLRGHADKVFALAFSPDGARIASASQDGTARLWNAKTGAPIGQPMRHDDSVYSVVFSPDGTSVATASRDGTARLWDARSGQPISAPLGQSRAMLSVAISLDGKYLATSCYGGPVQLWDIHTGASIAEFHGDGATAVLFSSDGSRLAVVITKVVEEVRHGPLLVRV